MVMWVVLIVLGCAGVCLGSDGSLVCKACEHGNLVGVFICEKCGYWLESSERPIKNEATLGVSVANSSNEMKWYIWDRNEWRSEILEVNSDTMTIWADLVHYSEGRYQHPEVPLRFIPYNYRTNSFGLSLSSSVTDFWLNNEYDEPASTAKEAYWTSVGGQHYFQDNNPVFITGNVLYEHQSVDGIYNYEWKRQWFVSDLAVGLQSPKYKLSLTVHNNTWSPEHLFSAGSMHYWSAGSFLEYMINPRLMVRTGYERLLENDDYDRAWTVPFSLSYISPEPWLELGPKAVYARYEWGDIFNAEFGLRRFFGDNEIYFIPKYTCYDLKSVTGTNSLVTLTMGGSLVSQRRFIVLPSISLTQGENPLVGADNVTGVEFNLAFKALL
jgi:hypothetical protein